MKVFNPNIPWIPDSSEYNCTGRSLSEWKSRGTANYVLGTYLAISGAFFMLLYVLCLVGMVRGKLLKIPCYRLLFFNGIIDNMDLVICSPVTAYLHFTGAVYCSSPTFIWYAGYFSWCIWAGASFNCMVLAFNRVVDMVPAANKLRFLFQGKLLYSWMLLSLIFMAVLPFISRAHLYNSVIATFILSPAITNDAAREASYFAVLLQPGYNITVVVVLLSFYSFLCFEVVRMRVGSKRSNYKFQIQLFTQALLICATTAIASLLYALLPFLSVPIEFGVASHIIWQFSHGLHGVVYICLNRRIRAEVLGMFSKNQQQLVRSVATIQNRQPNRV